MLSNDNFTFYPLPFTLKLPTVAAAAVTAATTTAAAISAATTAAAAAISTATAAAAVTAATAAAAFFTRAGFVDYQVASVIFDSVKLRNCCVGIIRRRHFDKAESA
jgi:hypothetical protein